MISKFPAVFRCLSLHSSGGGVCVMCANIQAAGCQSRCPEIRSYLISIWPLEDLSRVIFGFL